MSRPTLLALATALTCATAPAAAQLPRVTPVASIGCEECGGPQEFGELLDVSVDSDGGVLVLTNSAPFVRRFAANGSPAWSAGVAGSGPGEFQRALWAMLAPTGVQVVDMGARRVSRLDATGAFRGSASFRGFAPTVAARGSSGEFVMLIDDFRGGYRLERWTAADSGQPYFALPTEPREPGAIVFTAMAIATDGRLALIRDINTYRVQVFDRDGTLLRTLTREIPQVRRTAEELAAQERTRQRAAARVAAERGAAPARGAPPAPRPGGNPDLKPHVSIDGLQYDDRGRLWLRTMRGDHTVTVFDVFADSGEFLGELRVPGVLGSFSLAGPWLAAATESDDGYPIVRIYRVN
ncbi:MAG: hypothetical protein KF709_06110 [Gemmatimonadaceae bacterium]|nr:hypothetical protein [Gemmatimonadaceae bacterium]